VDADEQQAVTQERTNNMNNTIRTLLVCAIACATPVKAATDLTGTWQINYQDDNGVSTSNPILVLHQTDGKLTGTFGNLDWPVIGTVDGNHVVFTFVAYGREDGRPISDTVFYWGTVDETGKMKGRMKNPKEAGEWVAAKK
jgi:hypothetical protein